MQVGPLVGADPTSVRNWAKLVGMTFLPSNPAGGGGISQRFREVDWFDDDDDGIELGQRLGYRARILIETRLADGWSQRRIATLLGVAPSTVSREVSRGRQLSNRGTYHAYRAEGQARRRRKRPKVHKLETNQQLQQVVVELLNKKYSPEQISAELEYLFPNDRQMRISHETIYQALYVQGKGALRHELTVEKALRSGRTSRKPQSKLPERRGRKRWVEGANIRLRPAEAEDRAVPGHWEGDLIIGHGGKNALISLVERSTRYALLGLLPTNHESGTVIEKLTEMINTLPESLKRSLTWDQGSEMAQVATFTMNTNMPVYFCDPHSPWQRGTNENTNGLIRDFYPKGTSFAQLTEEELAHTEYLLNIRPRKTLGFRSPAYKLNQLLTVAPTT